MDVPTAEAHTVQQGDLSTYEKVASALPTKFVEGQAAGPGSLDSQPVAASDLPPEAAAITAAASTRQSQAVPLPPVESVQPSRPPSVATSQTGIKAAQIGHFAVQTNTTSQQTESYRGFSLSELLAQHSSSRDAVNKRKDKV